MAIERKTTFCRVCDTKSSIFLGIGLDDGLYARIVEQTLDQAAEVYFDVVRNK